MAELFIEDVEELAYGEEEKEVEMKTVATRLNCRKTPNGDVVKIYEEGTQIEILDIDGEWAKTPDGWVMKKFLK